MDPYRDETEVLRAKNARLEEEATSLRTELERAKGRLAEARRGPWLFAGAVTVAVGAFAVGRLSSFTHTDPFVPPASPVQGNRDLAGHKYRRSGDRSPWLTVNGGPLYVHAVGGFLSGDTGKTDLSIFDIMTKGENGGYRVARGGRTLLEVTSADGKRVMGRFEADVSKVDDVTREAPFGTPVVRARGTFCLPQMPPNPRDTGP